jgi:hypothetical protein
MDLPGVGGLIDPTAKGDERDNACTGFVKLDN